MGHLNHAVSVCARLIAPRPFREPLHLVVDGPARHVEIDTGSDRFALDDVSGNLEWLTSAYKLGGMLVRVTPTTSPDRVSLLANWEGHTASFCGLPSDLDETTDLPPRSVHDRP